MMQWLPDWLEIFITSMIPWIEARYVIPFWIHAGWQWWEVFPIAVAGNIVPIPFILLFFTFVERFLKRFAFWDRLMERTFMHTRSRANKTIQRYETFGLLLFVAIPIPFTGAWTGSLIAYLFGLPISRSFVTILGGVLCASSIMTAVSLLGVNIAYIFLGVLLIGILMALSMVYGMYFRKNKGDVCG